MEGHEERLRRIEEKLDQLLEREGSLDNGQQDSGGHERELDDGQADAHGADLALSVRGGQPGHDGMYVCRAEIANYGEGVAQQVRWWLSTREGEVVSTVAGGDRVSLRPRETVELEVVEIPGWEKFPLNHVWCRLAWRDAEGEHEKHRRYVESAAEMHRWTWRRPKR